MIGKRFTYDKPLVAFSKGGINDNVTGETYEFTMYTVLDLLNEFHEEKELEHKRVNYLKKIVAENCPTSLLIQVQNDLEWIE